MGIEIQQSASTRTSLSRLFRHVAAIGIGAILTGIVVGGIGGRLFMRVSGFLARERAGGLLTDNGNRIGEFTLAGTIGFVLFVGVLSGVLAAGAYAATEPWLAWAGRWRGFVFGGYLLAVGSSVVLDPGNFDFFVVGFKPANVAMIIAIFVAFGMVSVAVIEWLERRLPSDEEMSGAVAVYMIVTGIGLFLLIPPLIGFVTGRFCDCSNRPVLIGVLFAATALATIGYWVGRLLGAGRSTRRTLSLVGHLLVVGVFVAGALRVADDLSLIF